VRASGAHERISVKRTTAEQGKACAGDGHEGVQAASMEQVSPDRVTPGSRWLPQDKRPLLKRIVNLRRPPWLGTTTRESGALEILAMRCARTRGHRPVQSSRAGPTEHAKKITRPQDRVIGSVAINAALWGVNSVRSHSLDELAWNDRNERYAQGTEDQEDEHD
jgi:hypothetical protein